MNVIQRIILPWAKAHLAGLGAAVSLWVGLGGGTALTVQQWVAVVMTGLGVGGAVALTPNTAAPVPVDAPVPVSQDAGDPPAPATAP